MKRVCSVLVLAAVAIVMVLTGVEIAGLVLGGLPVVISALESYRKGLNPLHVAGSDDADRDLAGHDLSRYIRLVGSFPIRQYPLDSTSRKRRSPLS